MSKLTSRKGFTLIELMIVVAIIGILAAIAIPNFIRYQLRSKSTEAKTILGGIKTSEESFRAEYDAYVAVGPQNPALAPVGARSQKAAWDVIPCGATCNRAAIAGGMSVANCVSYECIGYRPSGDVYYSYDTDITDVANTAPEFTTCATADLDADGVRGGFTYGTGNALNSGSMVVTANATCGPLNGNAACTGAPAAAGTAAANEVIDCDTRNF